MKKLNITKEAYNKSRYFTSKYGKLKYVSESGNVYKTSKGQLLKFNESIISAKDAFAISQANMDGVEESIMSAKSARSAVKSGKESIKNSKEYVDGMKRIERDIKKAAEKGDTSTHWNIFEEFEWPFLIDSPEYNMCIEELKQAGYKVELGEFDDEYQSLTVSWDE